LQCSEGEGSWKRECPKRVYHEGQASTSPPPRVFERIKAVLEKEIPKILRPKIKIIYKKLFCPEYSREINKSSLKRQYASKFVFEQPPLPPTPEES
jgi:hypothetical protein